MKKLTVKFTAYLLSVFICSSALACSCRLGDVDEKFAQHEFVFTGKVSNIVRLDARNAFGDPAIIVTFEVEKSWKGAGKTIVLHTAENAMGCYGYWFKEGHDYLVFAFQDQLKQLDTFWCGGVIPKLTNEGEPSSNYSEEVQQLNHLSEQ